MVEEALVRREALRERRNVVPMSATDDEKLLRAWCRRRGGVSGVVVGGRLVLLALPVVVLLLLLLVLGVGGCRDRDDDLLKKDGRLEKRPEAVVAVAVAVAVVADDAVERVLLLAVLVELEEEERVELPVGWCRRWSAMASVPAHGRAGTGRCRYL